MPQNLHGRSFLKLLDFSPDELRSLLRLAASLKEAKATGTERQRLTGKNIALIFEKDSTRTRSAFEVAAYDQGAQVTYLGPSGSHIGTKETKTINSEFKRVVVAVVQELTDIICCMLIKKLHII